MTAHALSFRSAPFELIVADASCARADTDDAAPLSVNFSFELTLPEIQFSLEFLVSDLERIGFFGCCSDPCNLTRRGSVHPFAEGYFLLFIESIIRIRFCFVPVFNDEVCLVGAVPACPECVYLIFNGQYLGFNCIFIINKFITYHCYFSFSFRFNDRVHGVLKE